MTPINDLKQITLRKKNLIFSCSSIQILPTFLNFYEISPSLKIDVFQVPIVSPRAHVFLVSTLYVLPIVSRKQQEV